MAKKKAIGIDLGGTNLRVALVGPNGKIERKIKVPSTGDTSALLKDAVHELDCPEVEGIGVATAGVLDKASNSIVTSPNLPHMNGFCFDTLVEGEKPVCAENDANAAALGEKWKGAGKNYRNFVLFTLGTGIGFGVVHENRLLKIAAEGGHITIQADGKRCPCGNSGCLEMYAAKHAIVDAATGELEKGRQSLLRDCCGGSFYKLTPEDIYEHALEGDILSLEVLRDAGRSFGIGMAAMVNIFSPEAVVLSGGLTGAWDIYVNEAIREARKRAFEYLAGGLEVVPAALGDEAGLMGAAALILKRN